MVAAYKSPLKACKAVVNEAYKLWLQYDVRTDDITMIAIYLEDTVSAALPPVTFSNFNFLHSDDPSDRPRVAPMVDLALTGRPSGSTRGREGRSRHCRLLARCRCALQ